MVPKYEQGLVENPAEGTNVPNSWRRIDTVWIQDVDKQEMGSNAVRYTTVDGQQVAEKYKRYAKRTTFKHIRTPYKTSWDDNAIPVLKEASKIMAWLRQ